MRELDQKSTPLELDSKIDLAVRLLKRGELVAFPTETVYGLGADATNPQAVAKVFSAKQRPYNHPLIVHLSDSSDLSNWAINIPDEVYELAKKFWPGPLTFILDKHPCVNYAVTGGKNSIAVRVPSHPITLALLRKMGTGLVGPSANTFGRISPTIAAHVHNDLGAKVSMVLDGGRCCVGIESTIIDFTVDKPVILRQGVLTAMQLARVLNQSIKVNHEIKGVPGSHKSHYSPICPTYLVSRNNLDMATKNFIEQGKKVAILYLTTEPNDYAQQLYAKLHYFDSNFDVILIEQPPANKAWSAICDRLSRAAFQYMNNNNIQSSLDSQVCNDV